MEASRLKHLAVALLLTIVFSLQGCAGLAVGTVGTVQSASDSVEITENRNHFSVSTGDDKPALTESELLAKWGDPDSRNTIGNCDVLSYSNGLSWGGIGALVIIVPIPLVVPTGHYENTFYFRDGKLVGKVSDHFDIQSAFGFTCGSNECAGHAGTVNVSDSIPVRDWCGV